MSRKKEERKKERKRKNAIYSGHLHLCHQPRAAHALRSDQFINNLMQVPSPEMGNKTLTGTLESHVGVKECKGWFSQTLPWEELIYGQESVVS